MSLLTKILGRDSEAGGIIECSKKLCRDGYNFIIINYESIEIEAGVAAVMAMLEDPANESILDRIGYLRPPITLSEKLSFNVNDIELELKDKIVIDMGNEHGFFGKNPEKTFLIPYLRKLYEFRKQSYIIILNKPPFNLDKSLFEYESFSKDIFTLTNNEER